MGSPLSPSLMPSVALRGETLVLSLMDAVTPVVWQFDLEGVSASALEVMAVGDQGFVVRLKTPEGEVQDIATYTDRMKAITVLTLVHQALAGKNYPAVSELQKQVEDGCCDDVCCATRVPTRRNLKLAVAAFLVFVLVIWGLGAVMPLSTGNPQQASAVMNAPLGEPMSADDMLKGRAR